MLKINHGVLFPYFLQLLFLRFIAFTGLIATVLLAAHYLITLRFLAPGLLSPWVLVFLIPHLLSYAIPLALCLAVGTAFLLIRQQNEELWVRSLVGAHIVWRTSIGLVVAFGMALFLWCSGWLGPQCYQQAKRLLVAQAARTIMHMPAQTPIHFTKNIHLWYDKRVSKTVWQGVRIGIRGRKGLNVVIAAQRVCLDKTGMTFLSGSIAQWGEKQVAHHRFDRMHSLYAELFGGIKKSTTRPKHATMSCLWQEWSRQKCSQELVRRSIQFLLVGALPGVILWVLTVFSVTTFMPLFGLSVFLFAGMQLLCSFGAEVVAEVFF